MNGKATITCRRCGAVYVSDKPDHTGSDVTIPICQRCATPEDAKEYDWRRLALNQPGNST